MSFVSLEIINHSLESQRQQLQAEFEAERTNHQRVLRDYDRLEQRYQNLHEEMEMEKFIPVKREVDDLISASSSGEWKILSLLRRFSCLRVGIWT